MRISELLEALEPVGSTTDQISNDPPDANQAPTDVPTDQVDSNEPPQPGQQLGKPAQPTGKPAQPAGKPADPNQAQVQQPNPAMQQGMKDTMTDLDNIAAQIVLLKQKQQQMQQQMQKPAA